MNARVVTLTDLHQAWQQQTSLATVSSADEEGALRGPVVAVIGAGGGVGATTVALALAEQLAGSRLLECCTTPVSGLAAATNAELAAGPGGWRRGLRDGTDGPVLIERAPQAVRSPLDLPPPAEPGRSERVTILDAGWTLTHTAGWLRRAILDADAIVVVAPGTCPGLEHLEATLREIETSSTAGVTAAVGGPNLNRWPRALRTSVGLRTHRLLTRGELRAFEQHRALRLLGLTPSPLPAAVAACGRELAEHLVPCLRPVEPSHQTAAASSSRWKGIPHDAEHR